MGAEQDRLGGFLAECCQLGPFFTAPVGELYDAYTAFCEAAGEEVLGKTKVGKMLRARGLSQKQEGPDRTRIWIGIKLQKGESSGGA